MRYPKDHKDAAREKLVRLSGSHAKKHGFGATGMASLAAAAGVTTGALYKHFDGKADLFAAVVAAELERTAQMYEATDMAGQAGAARLLAGYLSLQHVRHPEQGCPLPSLTPEVARADAAARQAFQAGLLRIHELLQRVSASPEAAWAYIAQNVGGVMLARALADEAIQRELLAALRKTGKTLLAVHDPGENRPVGLQSADEATSHERRPSLPGGLARGRTSRRTPRPTPRRTSR